MIEAALEMGCRKGELLSLQWAEVSLAHGVIVLPAEKTKTAETRTVPITSRLDAILKMRQTAPDGKDHKPTAHVFGNEVGEEVKSIKMHVAAHLPPSRDCQSPLPRLAARVWLAVAGDPRHVAQRSPIVVGLIDGRADLDLSGDHGDEVAGDGPPLRDCPTGLHKPCTKRRKRPGACLRDAFESAR